METPDSELTQTWDTGAGGFTGWLAATQAGQAADVPCGDCNGCCKSFYFIHIEPDEVEALAHIPAELLFPAPGMPSGHQVMGHDEFGCCPMLVNEQCSIYAHRPKTCRVYDCRLFAAVNMPAGEGDKVLINERARRWRFDDEGHSARAATLAATDFLITHQTEFEPGLLPTNPTQRALLVLRIHELFLHNGEAEDQQAQSAQWVQEKIKRIAQLIEHARQSS